MRRLAHALAQRGHSVDLVTYGHTRLSVEEHSPILRSIRTASFAEGLSALIGQDHILTVYLNPTDRLKFARFRGTQRNQSTFHMLYLGWPESPLRREMAFLDAGLFPFNGRLIGVSDRLVKRLRRIDPKAHLMWPPVPADYFAPPRSRASSGRVSVVFVGRVDAGKGIVEVSRIVDELSRVPSVDVRIVGIHWPHSPDSLRLHRYLLRQFGDCYIPTDHDAHTRETERTVRNLLAGSDILLQPYRRLSSTIDTPLLLLEAIASLTAVITRPYGGIPTLYGPSPCLVQDPDIVVRTVELVRSAPEWLEAERQRLATRRHSVCHESRRVADDLLSVMRSP